MEEKQSHNAPLRKIIRNFIWLFLQLGITRSFGFVFTIILARNLAQSDFGRYTYAIGITGIFLIVSDLGLLSLGLREISRQRENVSAIFSRLLLAKIPLMTIVYLVFAVVLLLLPSNGGRLAVLLLATAYFAENLAGFMIMPFKATEQMQYPAIGDFIYKCLLIGGALGVLLIKPTLVNLTGVYLTCSTLYLAGYAVLYARYFGFKPVCSGINGIIANCIASIRSSAPIAFGGLIMVVYINADVVMLKWFKGEVVTGIYGVSYSFYLGLALAASILVQSVVPRLSRSFETDDPEMRATVLRGTVKLLFLLSVPLACGGVLLSDQIISFFYGARYLDSQPAFRIFMITLVFNYLNLLLCYYLFAQRKQHEINITFLITISLNIILNLALIPRFSIAGAAIATLTAEAVYTVIVLARHREFLTYFRFSWIWRMGCATGAMSLVVLALRGPGGFVSSLLCGGAVYAAIIWVSGAIRNEKELLLGMFGRFHGHQTSKALGKS